MELVMSGKEIQDAARRLSGIGNKPVRHVTEPQFKIAYRLKRIVDKLGSAFNDIDKERVKLVKFYGVENKDKSGFKVPEDKIDDFNKAYEKLLAEKVKVDIELIPLEAISAAGVEITLLELASIDQFIDRPKEG
jgi:hypothetical protein